MYAVCGGRREERKGAQMENKVEFVGVPAYALQGRFNLPARFRGTTTKFRYWRSDSCAAIQSEDGKFSAEVPTDAALEFEEQQTAYVAARDRQRQANAAARAAEQRARWEVQKRARAVADRRATMATLAANRKAASRFDTVPPEVWTALDKLVESASPAEMAV